MEQTHKLSLGTTAFVNVKGLRSFSSSTAHGRSLTHLQTLVTHRRQQGGTE